MDQARGGLAGTGRVSLGREATAEMQIQSQARVPPHSVTPAGISGGTCFFLLYSQGTPCCMKSVAALFPDNNE